MRKPIILVGGGGHCKSCIEVIESTKLFDIIGILDLPELLDQNILEYKIIGNDNDIENYAKKGFSFCITVGQVGNARLRIKLFNLVLEKGGILPVIIAPTSYVSKYATIGIGTIIMHHAFVNAGCIIGVNNIINTKALIEHDCFIGNNVHLSTASKTNGTCNIGDNCMIGSGAILKNNIDICADALIGAGSVVTKNITEAGVYVGNPAHKIK